MSLHKSLKSRSALERRRNVLTRSERIERLAKEDRWDPEKDSVFGLPKVKIMVRAAPKKRKRKAEEAAKEGTLDNTEA
jgi:small basic protein (TIGR04137 family)